MKNQIREVLENYLETDFDINTDGSNEWWITKESKDQATQAILELIEEIVPDRYDMQPYYGIKSDSPEAPEMRFREGYNQAISDIKAQLGGSDEED